MLEIWESYIRSDIDTIKWETHFHFALFHFLITLLYFGLCKVSLVNKSNYTEWGARNNDSCREFFELIKILPSSAQYIYSLLMFVVNNRNLFLDNAEWYTTETRNSYNVHPPLSHLTKYQKGVHYAGIRVFYHLPTSIKCIANETKMLKKTLQRFLLDNSFYSIDEYFNFKK